MTGWITFCFLLLFMLYEWQGKPDLAMFAAIAAGLFAIATEIKALSRMRTRA